MKFEPSKLSRVIEQNYSHLMPIFFEMQTEYFVSLNTIYNDLDTSLVAMVITKELCKSTINVNGDLDDFSLKSFYEKENFQLPISSCKIKAISSILNLPRETVRRKRENLNKNKIIILDKKNKLYSFSANKINKKILEVQMHNLSKFLFKFSTFFSQNKFFIKEVPLEQISKDVDKKFLIYLAKFLDFQIAYFANLKKIMDIESVFISLLCSLNTLSSREYQNEKPLNLKKIFCRIHELNDSSGLNATSISEITKIPRTTVLRKIVNLEKIGMLKKDKFKRYAPENLNNSKESKKLTLTIQYSLELLGVFFAQCLETYSVKK